MNIQQPRLFTVKNSILLLIPIILLLAILPFQFKKSLNIYPRHTNLELTSYLDSTSTDKDSGTIIHKFDTSGALINLEYTIGSKSFIPYAGFQWIVRKGNPWIDIRGYDHCTFTIDSGTTEEVCILIMQFYTEQFSNLDDRMTWRYMSKEITLLRGKMTYSIPLQDLKTPQWWFNQYKKTETEFADVDLSRLGMISIEEGADAVGKRRNIALKSLSFEKKSGYAIAKILIITSILYYLSFFGSVWFLSRFKRLKKPIIIPYQKLAIVDENTRDEQLVFEYLGNNFSDSDLSLSKISNAIGIPGNRVSYIVKEKYNLSFRQYLNSIRITEAKRLLQETKIQISQIGYKVGYSNLTHFCRTFKDVTGISPNSFRLGSTSTNEDFDEVIEETMSR